MPLPLPSLRIFGLDFFTGDCADAITFLQRQGGLLTAPSAPVLADAPDQPELWQALAESDIILPDSGLLVLEWNLISFDHLTRLSGLRFLREFFQRPGDHQSRSLFLVNPTDEAGHRNRAWITQHWEGEFTTESNYTAPFYGRGELRDPELLKRIDDLRPAWILINIGGGTQERLGAYLKRNLSYSPTIICTGAAIAFLTGEQASIPPWADRYYLGWLFRILEDPRKYGRRYANSAALIPALAAARRNAPEAMQLRLNQRDAATVEAPGSGRRDHTPSETGPDPRQ